MKKGDDGDGNNGSALSEEGAIKESTIMDAFEHSSVAGLCLYVCGEGSDYTWTPWM